MEYLNFIWSTREGKCILAIWLIVFFIGLALFSSFPYILYVILAVFVLDVIISYVMFNRKNGKI